MNSANIFRETTILQENKLYLHTYITYLHVVYLSEVGGHLITLNPQIFTGSLAITHLTLLALSDMWWDAHYQSHLQPVEKIMRPCAWICTSENTAVCVNQVPNHTLHSKPLSTYIKCL